MVARAVQRSAEFERIAALPRRTITRADAERMARQLTPHYRRKGASCELLPWQGAGLFELRREGGIYALFPVGTGKTLFLELAPRAVDVPGHRAVLLGPATARQKTLDDRAALREAGWLLSSPPPQFVSREELALDKNERLLFDLDPDFIGIDEADEWSNFMRTRAGAAAPKRVGRYLAHRAKQGRDVYVVATSGTAMNHSVLDFWHLLAWALGDGSPMPLDVQEAKTWASVLDDKPIGLGRRPAAGALGRNVSEAREWFAERLATTPGVIIVDEDSAGDVPLVIRAEYAPECPEINAAYEEFALTEKFGDINAESPLDKYRIEGRLGCGYVEAFADPQPPQAWKDARLARNKYVMHKIETSADSDRPLDTPAAVERVHADAKPIKDWKRVKPTCTPVTEAQWFSDSTINHCADWLAKTSEPSIVWVGGVEFGERLAEVTGLSYYGLGGKDQHGQFLNRADPAKSMIVSWNAGKRIFNLQAWRRQLVVEPPPRAHLFEQLLGRAHRQGQEFAVRFFLLVTSGSVLDYFENAIRQAQSAKSIQRVRQKLIRADIDLGKLPRRTKANQFRWARRS